MLGGNIKAKEFRDKYDMIETEYIKGWMTPDEHGYYVTVSIRKK